jgi:hypothetical protein
MQVGDRVIVLESSMGGLKDRNFWEAGDVGTIEELDSDREQAHVQFEVPQCGTGLYWVPWDLLTLAPRDPRVHLKRGQNGSKILSRIEAQSTAQKKKRKYPDKDHRNSRCKLLDPKVLNALTAATPEMKVEQSTEVENESVDENRVEDKVEDTEGAVVLDLLSPSLGTGCSTHQMSKTYTPIHGFGLCDADRENIKRQVQDRKARQAGTREPILLGPPIATLRAKMVRSERSTQVSAIDTGKKRKSSKTRNYPFRNRRNVKIMGIVTPLAELEELGLREVLNSLKVGQYILLECDSEKVDGEAGNLYTACKIIGLSCVPNRKYEVTKHTMVRSATRGGGNQTVPQLTHIIKIEPTEEI